MKRKVTTLFSAISLILASQTNSWAVDAVPDIKANTSDNPIEISSTAHLSVTVTLNNNDQSDNADWWLVANTPTGLFSYQENLGWQAGVAPMKQAALTSLSEQEVLNGTGLPAGTYTLYFGFDSNPNGEIDFDQLTYDSVNVISTDLVYNVNGLDPNLFFEGALAKQPVIQDCTLSDGTETTCYEITVTGYPANHEAGPFCPKTITDTAENVGIWLDGNGVYDATGEFILGLADLYNDSDWKMYDDDGNVNVTDTKEKFELAAVPDVDEALHNHCVEGRVEWLENGEPIQTTVLIPTTPVKAASVTSATNGNLGITLNGVVIAHSAPVAAILSAHTIAAFDDCGGHFNPFDGYHMHGARGCSEVGETANGETPIFAYALDGYPIHSPLNAADEVAAVLDECHGHTTEAHGYHYHAASVEKNEILSCFTGMTVASNQPEGEQGLNDGERPDLAAAATTLGVSEQDLINALGTAPPDFDAAAATLGVTVEALQEALGGQSLQG